MRRTALLLACVGGLLAADPSASDIAAELIATRARELSQHGQGELAHQLEELAAGVRAARITLGDAQQVLAVAQALPPVGLPPGSRPLPGLTAAQAGAALDGRPLAPPAVAAPAPSPTAALAPPPPAASAAVATPAAVPPPAGPEPVVIGRLLAVQPGGEGKPALLAFAPNPKVPVTEGQRVAVRRDHATLALARVTRVSSDMIIALLIPGTWSDGTAEVRVDDEVALIDQ